MTIPFENEIASFYHVMLVNYICKTLIFFKACVVKLFTFHIILFSKLLTFPISIPNFFFIYVKKILVSSIKSIINWNKSHLIKVGTRFRRAVACSIYVLLVLIVLLVSCFAVSSVAMAAMAEAPIHVTQTLNFDYTKPNPSAVVPISGILGSKIKYYNRLRLTVSLKLPESEYNVKLGIFQVRVETLSAKGDVISGSSYPAMLRFKSHVVRVIESSVKMVPLVTGLKSEVQDVRIDVKELGEGCEVIRVSVEKRAEVRDGHGVPQIYGASLGIASKLPIFKRIVWNCKLTIFVWIGFVSFLVELVVVLLFCKPIVLPQSR